MPRPKGYTIAPTVRLITAATVIINSTIPPRARDALGVLAVRDLRTTRGYENTAVGEHVLEVVAALQLEDVGTASRAVKRANT